MNYQERIYKILVEEPTDWSQVNDTDEVEKVGSKRYTAPYKRTNRPKSNFTKSRKSLRPSEAGQTQRSISDALKKDKSISTAQEREKRRQQGT